MDDLKMDNLSAQELAEYGEKYYMGEGAERDYDKAFELFSKSAAMGNKEAMNRLYFCYIFGNGVDKDDEIAMSWLKQAVDADSIEGQYKIGQAYKFRFDSYHSEVLEIKGDLLSNATDETYASVINEIASGEVERSVLKRSEEDFKQAEKWLMLAARQGNVFAQYSLAEIYREWVQFELIDASFAKESFYWFEQAAMQGDDLAKQYVAQFYLDGFGVEKDAEKGLSMLLELAETSGSAQYEVARRYRYGDGVQASVVNAIEWYVKAIESGQDWCTGDVIRYLLDLAEGVLNDPDCDNDIAESLYGIAADLGDESAKECLAKINAQKKAEEARKSASAVKTVPARKTAPAKSSKKKLTLNKYTVSFAIVVILYLISMASYVAEVVTGEPVAFYMLVLAGMAIFWIKTFIRTPKWIKIGAIVGFIIVAVVIGIGLEMLGMVLLVTVPYFLCLIHLACIIMDWE